jgi:hypothetical protein
MCYRGLSSFNVARYDVTFEGLGASLPLPSSLHYNQQLTGPALCPDAGLARLALSFEALAEKGY